jgi:hypothetical protein
MHPLVATNSSLWSCSYLQYFCESVGRRDPSRWSRGPLYLQKLSLISVTGSGCSVSIVCSRTQATEFFYSFISMSQHNQSQTVQFSSLVNVSWNNSLSANPYAKRGKICSLNSEECSWCEHMTVVCELFSDEPSNYKNYNFIIETHSVVGHTCVVTYDCFCYRRQLHTYLSPTCVVTYDCFCYRRQLHTYLSPTCVVTYDCFCYRRQLHTYLSPSLLKKDKKVSKLFCLTVVVLGSCTWSK